MRSGLYTFLELKIKTLGKFIKSKNTATTVSVISYSDMAAFRIPLIFYEHLINFSC